MTKIAITLAVWFWCLEFSVAFGQSRTLALSQNSSVDIDVVTKRTIHSLWLIVGILAGMPWLPEGRGCGANGKRLPAAERIGPTAMLPELVRRVSTPFGAEGDELMELLNACLAEAEDDQMSLAGRRDAMLTDCPLTDMTMEDLKECFSVRAGDWTRKDRRALRELKRRLMDGRLAGEGSDRELLVREMREIAAAISLNHRSPAPQYVDFLAVPFVFLDHLHHPVGRGTRQATNLARTAEPGEDRGMVDPESSTFWQRPRSIGQADLFSGFGRSRVPDHEGVIWTYSAPKLSYGGNPGFEVQGAGVRAKVKFAEVSSEPFVARIFAALGYHVEATDYVPSIRVRYDRRLLREFHLRRDVTIRFGIARVLPLYRMSLQRRFDPLDYIVRAVLRDGRHITGGELRRLLFHDPDRRHPEESVDNFRTEFEGMIDHLVTTSANFQIENPAERSLGPWAFDMLGHADLRELRGAGLLAAWLGWFDSRFENMRLKTVDSGTRRELRHYFSDVGGGLGRAGGTFGHRSESPNAFPWSFTQPARASAPGRMNVPFRIVGYQPIVETGAFAEMTVDDARWMGRLIGELTEAQILQGLIASGYDSAPARLYLEKLISRRDRMIRDLGLADEFRMLRPDGSNRRFSYDPKIEGPMVADNHARNGKVAAIGAEVVEDGVLMPRRHAR